MKLILGVLLVLTALPVKAVETPYPIRETKTERDASAINQNFRALSDDARKFKGTWKADILDDNNTWAGTAEWSVSGSTVVQIGPDGSISFPQKTKAQVDSLTPNRKGAHITVTNYSNLTIAPEGYADCISTGTAVAQWAIVGGTHGVNQNGCGTGQ